MKNYKKLIFICSLVFVMFILTSAVSAADDVNDTVASDDVNQLTAENDAIYVDWVNGDDSNSGQDWTNSVKTIEKGLNKVNSNGYVYLANNTFSTSGVTISKSVNVVGQEGTVIDGGYSQIFTVSASATVHFSNMTIINAKTTGYGAAFNNGGNLTVSNILFANGSAQGGPAIDNAQYLTVINCTFLNNVATRDGGALSQNAQTTDTMVVINSTFKNNRGGRNAGCIKYQGSNIPLVVIGCWFENCTTDAFTDNWGGAVYTFHAGASISDSVFIDNHAQDGGAVFVGGVYAEALDIDHCVFINNTATRNGDSVYFDWNQYERFTLTNSIIVDNDICVYDKVNNVNINNNWWGSNEPDFSAMIAQGSWRPTVWAQFNMTVEPTEVTIGDSAIVTGYFTWNNGTSEGIEILPLRNVVLSSTGGDFDKNNIDVGSSATFTPSTGGNVRIIGTVDNQQITQSLKVNLKDEVYVDYVNGDDDNEGDSFENAVKTIEHALYLVNENGNIYLAGNTFSTSGVTISKSVNVVGQEGTVIDGGYSQIFTVSASATVHFSDMTIINAKTTGYGAAFNNGGNLTVSNILFANGSAQGGPAIDNAQYLTVINCTFLNNVATRDGGALSQNAETTDTMVVINSTFKNNRAGRNAGCIKYQGSDTPLVIIGCLFENCTTNAFTDNWGGAVYTFHASANISDSVFIDNHAQDGGAVYVGGKYANTLDIVRCVFINNTAARNGDSVYFDRNTYDRFTLNDCVIVNNNIYVPDTVRTVNIEDNWWGSNSPDFNSMIKGINWGPTTWALFNVSAEPNIIVVGDSIPVFGYFIWNNGTSEGVELIPNRNLALSSEYGIFDTNEFVLGVPYSFTSTRVGNGVIVGVVDNQKIETNVTIMLQDIIYVDYVNGDDSNSGKTLEDPVKTIEHALAIVKEKGNIVLANNTLYKVSKDAISIDKNVNVIGQKGSVIDANGTQMFAIPEDVAVTFTNMIIVNAKSDDDAAVFDNEGKLTLKNITFANCTSKKDSLIFTDEDSTLEISDCVFEDNTGALLISRDAKKLDLNGLELNNDEKATRDMLILIIGDDANISDIEVNGGSGTVIRVIGDDVNITNVDISNHDGDGVVVTGDDAYINAVNVANGAGDAVKVTGDDAKVNGVSAVNQAGDVVTVTGDNADVSQVVANGGTGTVVKTNGDNNNVSNITANGGKGNVVEAAGANATIQDITVDRRDGTPVIAPADAKISGVTVNKDKTTISAPKVTITGTSGIFKVTLNDKVAGKTISIKLNGKTYKVTTDANGVAKLKLTKKMLAKVGSKTVTIRFDEDNLYYGSSATSKITVRNKPVLKVKSVKKSYKRSAKTKKIRITLKDQFGKKITGKVKIKFTTKKSKIKGNKKAGKKLVKKLKKGYTIKVKKGVATLKLSSKKVKFTKKGKYGYTVTFKKAGYYNKVVKKGKLRIK